MAGTVVSLYWDDVSSSYLAHSVVVSVERSTTGM